MIGIANILVNLAYYTRKERAELHKSIQYSWDAFPAIGNEEISIEELREMNIIDSIITFVCGLGLSESFIRKAYAEMIPSHPDEQDCLLERESTLELCQLFELADLAYDKYIQNLLQNFVHIAHNTFRIGGDSPFTNISLFDRDTFCTVFADPLYPDFSKVVDNYEEVSRVQKIFVEFFSTGSPATGKPYRFPVVSANIKKDSNGVITDKEFFDYIMLKNKIKGAFNIHVGEKIATCCRLTSDLSTLKENIRMDSFGNGGLSIGSHRVVAINLHRVALIATTENKSFTSVLLTCLLDAERLLMAHKKILKESIDANFLNFFNIKWENLDMFFSTIGFTGLVDAYSVMNHTTLDSALSSKTALDSYVEFATNTINMMEVFASTAGKRNPSSAFNVEEIPGENASPKMAQADNFIYGSREDYDSVDLLSNQMVPLYVQVPFMDRLEASGKLMNAVSGGSILHINLTEQVTDTAYLDLCKLIIEEFNIPHFSINVGTSTCENGHTVSGIYKDTCPICGGKEIDWTIRVVGFNTDVSSWSAERQREFHKRQFYTAQDILN